MCYVEGGSPDEKAAQKAMTHFLGCRPKGPKKSRIRGSTIICPGIPETQLIIAVPLRIMLILFLGVIFLG